RGPRAAPGGGGETTHLARGGGGGGGGGEESHTIIHLITADEWRATTTWLPGKNYGSHGRNTHVAEQESAKRADGLHAGRVVGGDRHHCHPHRFVAAGGAKDAQGSSPDEVREQPQATGPGRPQLREHLPVFPLLQLCYCPELDDHHPALHRARQRLQPRSDVAEWVQYSAGRGGQQLAKLSEAG